MESHHNTETLMMPVDHAESVGQRLRCTHFFTTKSPQLRSLTKRPALRGRLLRLNGIVEYAVMRKDVGSDSEPGGIG
jgi:hypothetical protein